MTRQLLVPESAGAEALVPAAAASAREPMPSAPQQAPIQESLAARAVPDQLRQPEAASAQRAAELQSSLAVPSLNSSLLRLQQADALKQQAAATVAAPPPLPEEQMQAARQRAATAATTLPPGERIFGSLPPPSARTARKISASKQDALVSAQKQLNERWVAEQAELQPRLEQLWPPPWERTAPLPLPLPPLVVPLPDRRQLAAGLLGLQL
ncbi:hypothetical protein ABPG77_008571 [Micractinium sp. CCAP 211/92]